MFEIKINNEKFKFYFAYEVNDYLKMINEMIDKIDQPFIFDINRYDNEFLTISYYDNSYKINRIFVKELQKISNKENIFDIAKELCEADEEWNAWRNEKLNHDYYYKFTFKPEYQEYILNILSDWKEKFKQISKDMNEIEDIKKQEKQNRKEKFSIVKQYKLDYPKGGEMGQDGYFDANIKNNVTNEIIRTVARNVFDFGFYTYPKRVEGTENIFKVDTWTDQEKQATDWLHEFSPFTTGIRM